MLVLWIWGVIKNDVQFLPRITNQRPIQFSVSDLIGRGMHSLAGLAAAFYVAPRTASRDDLEAAISFGDTRSRSASDAVRRWSE